MRFKLIIENPDIDWEEFSDLIRCNSDLSLLLKACYTKSKRRRGNGFAKKS
jgi:hypothetical protein